MAEPADKKYGRDVIGGSTRFVSITDTSDHVIPKSVHINVSDSYDFKDEDDAWVLFVCVAGTSPGIRPKAVRHNSGGTAPDSGDIVFLY